MHILSYEAVGQSRVSRHAALQIDDAILAALKSGILAEQFDDAGGVGASLQFVEDERLVLMGGAVHACLAGGDALTGHNHGLDVLQKIVSVPVHVEDAMTTRPVARSTAITDHVAKTGSSQTKKTDNSRMAFRMAFSKDLAAETAASNLVAPLYVKSGWWRWKLGAVLILRVGRLVRVPHFGEKSRLPS